MWLSSAGGQATPAREAPDDPPDQHCDEREAEGDMQRPAIGAPDPLGNEIGDLAAAPKDATMIAVTQCRPMVVES